MSYRTQQRLNRILSALLLLALCSACRAPTPDVDFCDVLKARATYLEREFRTEILAIPNYHGWVAGSFACPGVAIVFSESSFDGSPELKMLAENIEEAYRLHNPFNAPDPSKPDLPKGVVVRVTARIEESPSPPPRTALRPLPKYVLRLLSADASRVVDIPEDWFQPPSGVGPPPHAGP